MYQIGELVVYGTTGVCAVTDIRQQEFPTTGELRTYYVLRSLYDNCVISAPVDSDKVFVRRILSKDEADALIDDMPEVEAEEFSSRVSRELTEHYESLLKSHDCRSLVAMTRSIYLKKQRAESQNRKFGAVDGRFLKRAEDLLFGELAAALEIPRDQVPQYIADRLAVAAAK